MKKNTFADLKKIIINKKNMEYFDVNEIEEQIRNNKKRISAFVKISDSENILKKIEYDVKGELKGIYVFWYHNPNGEIENLKRELNIKGKKVKKTNCKIDKKVDENGYEIQGVDWNWHLDLEYVCLYVGKTTDFKERLKKHLLLGTDKLDNIGNKLNKKTTACQLRSGFDYLYSNTKGVNIKDELIEHLYVSFYPVKDDFIKRFYIENYFIGKFKPWFNLDSER